VFLATLLKHCCSRIALDPPSSLFPNQTAGSLIVPPIVGARFPTLAGCVLIEGAMHV
jgi:hypothetical protein